MFDSQGSDWRYIFMIRDHAWVKSITNMCEMYGTDAIAEGCKERQSSGSRGLKSPFALLHILEVLNEGGCQNISIFHLTILYNDWSPILKHLKNDEVDFVFDQNFCVL